MRAAMCIVLCTAPAVLAAPPSVLGALPAYQGQLQAETLSWTAYKAAFGKSYNAEETQRRTAYEASVVAILACNALADVGKQGYRCGVNQYSDLTHRQFKKRFLNSGFGKNPLPPPVRELDASAAPAAVDWRAKGAVTPVKNQGSCGSCWSFSTTGALEGAYQIATGALRVLSEQQLMDCSTSFGNNGCQGGAMSQAFDYIKANGGIDGETDYPYQGSNQECWKVAANRKIANLTDFSSVKVGSETQLSAAAALGPVSVAIEADQPVFQHYKSGTFDSPCGTKLDHGVLVVGYTADAYIVKNSWGATWGDKGFIMMKRNVNKTGICGIAMDASYPTVAKGSPLPVPPKTDPHTRPALPCNCTQSCTNTCAQFGMACCGDGINCDCSSLSSCPKCGPPPPPPYSACGQGCTGKVECVNTQGLPGHICAPLCPDHHTCPPVPVTAAGVTAKPWCDYCMTSRIKAAGTNTTTTANDPNKPTVCALVCTATTKGAPFKQDGCPAGATCKTFSLDKDPCETTHVDLPCAKTKTCGLCSYP